MDDADRATKEARCRQRQALCDAAEAQRQLEWRRMQLSRLEMLIVEARRRVTEAERTYAVALQRATQARGEALAVPPGQARPRRAAGLHGDAGTEALPSSLGHSSAEWFVSGVTV